MTLAEVQSIIYEQLNISKSVAYGTHDGSPQYKTEAVREAIFDADYEVARTVAKTPGHPERALYVNTGNVNTPQSWQPLAAADSSPEAVMITFGTTPTIAPGKTAPATSISQWYRNLAAHGGVEVVGGYYDIVNNYVFFSGISLTYKYYKVPALSPGSTNLNSPDVYRPTVVKLALARLLSKEEDSMQAAGFFAEQGRSDLMAIEKGEMVVPEAVLWQQKR